MRIGLEVQRLFRKKKHGMDIVALELIRNLQKLDQHNEYFVFVKDDEDNQVISETKNFRIIKINGGPYPYWEQVLLPRAVREHGIELLHCTSNTAPLNIKTPLIITLHDIIYLEQWNFTKGSWYQIVGNLYRRWNIPRIVSKAAHIITVSNFEKERITRYFNFSPNQISTVYNGVGTHFRKVTDPHTLKSVRKKYNLPENYLFFIGNTDPRKNVEGVLRAMAILKSQNKLNFRLQMLDMDRDFLRNVASAAGDISILENISFCGYVAEEDLPAIYSMATLFLFPSLREGFGIPILEAMRCEVPVITSNTSSMPEVAGDAALLIDPSKPQAIAEAITSLLDDPQRQKELVAKGLERSAYFSWMNNASQTLALYKKILSEESSGK